MGAKEIDQDAVRDFLAGVFGVDRNFYTHTKFEGESTIDVIRFCLNKLVIASEAHNLLDQCEVKKKGKWISLNNQPF